MTDAQFDQLVSKQLLNSKQRLRYWQTELHNATVEYNNTVTNTEQQRNTAINTLIQYVVQMCRSVLCCAVHINIIYMGCYCIENVNVGK